MVTLSGGRARFPIDPARRLARGWQVAALTPRTPGGAGVRSGRRGVFVLKSGVPPTGASFTFLEVVSKRERGVAVRILSNAAWGDGRNLENCAVAGNWETMPKVRVGMMAAEQGKGEGRMKGRAGCRAELHGGRRGCARRVRLGRESRPVLRRDYARDSVSRMKSRMRRARACQVNPAARAALAARMAARRAGASAPVVRASTVSARWLPSAPEAAT